MKVLVVEDERKLADYLRRALTEHGYVVDVAGDGREGLYFARETPYDLILLDVMLPGMDGFQLLRELRKQGRVPVLMLSARDRVEDRVRGLEDGADDYLPKPFSLTELMARIFALVRRNDPANLTDSHTNIVRVADLELDLLRRRVYRNEQPINLTVKEFALLQLFMRKRGQVLSRQTLAEQVWDINFNNNTNVVEAAVRRLRAKVDGPFENKLIHTVRGMGYVIEARDAEC
ncbi:response regulator [Pusillimonas caeni]|uniref:heavy metal response regulator transcription factor n=1 Tax=Pusillimonas caeni TaxID=1348472 RepID=UPI000E59F07D|nr:heavy metal response regulator transcription factor [Pusillimonas caeni]TFL13506.1 response regulator [Pusillimonas caeni]